MKHRGLLSRSSTGRAGASREVLRRHAARILESGLRAADPARLVTQNLSWRPGELRIAGRRIAVPRGRLVCVAVGKAAYRMASAAAEVLDLRPDAVLAVASEGTTPARPRVPVRLAAHPVPDERGLAAAEEVLALARSLGRDDLLLLLLSGGASALLPLPVLGLSLADKATTTSLLLRSGAGITEMNTVRRHLSRLKGGGLARAAAPARVQVLALSDVVGDDLSTIASGPCSPDPTTYDDAIAVLQARGIWPKVPSCVRRHLERGREGGAEETPKPGDACFERVGAMVIGSGRQSLQACARTARALGYATSLLTSRLVGEARETARVLVSVLRERAGAEASCLLAAGETTVTVRGEGHGGRNQEMATAAAGDLEGFPAPALAAFLGTDGVDGRSDAAGGVVDDHTAARARHIGLAPPEVFLKENDSRAYLGPVCGLIHTGPTGTNVADLAVLLVGSSRPLSRKGKSL